MTSKLFFCIIALTLCVAAGQIQHVQGQTSTEPKADQELNRKAQALLADTVPLLREFKNKDNQILSRIALAELQWKTQEKSARQLYKEAFDLVRQAWANLDSDDESFYSEQSVILLRNRVITSLASRDPTMARQLFEQMRVARSSKAPNTSAESDSKPIQNERADYDKQLEMSIALTSAEENSDELASIVRKQLDSGLTWETPDVLMKLARKDPKRAETLMTDVVAKFRKTDAKAPGFLEMTGFLLSQALATLSANKKQFEQSGMPVIPFPPDLSQQIIEFVTDAVLDSQSDPKLEYLLNSLRSVIEQIDEVAPKQAARLKMKFVELDKRSAPDNSYVRFRESADKKEIAGMLEAADKAPVEMRDMLYAQAASDAWDNGENAQARKS